MDAELKAGTPRSILVVHFFDDNSYRPQTENLFN